VECVLEKANWPWRRTTPVVVPPPKLESTSAVVVPPPKLESTSVPLQPPKVAGAWEPKVAPPPVKVLPLTTKPVMVPPPERKTLPLEPKPPKQPPPEALLPTGNDLSVAQSQKPFSEPKQPQAPPPAELLPFGDDPSVLRAQASRSNRSSAKPRAAASSASHSSVQSGAPASASDSSVRPKRMPTRPKTMPTEPPLIVTGPPKGHLFEALFGGPHQPRSSPPKHLLDASSRREACFLHVVLTFSLTQGMPTHVSIRQFYNCNVLG